MRIQQLFEAYTAYLLGSKDRRKLKKVFPPKYPTFVGHHITRQFGVPKNAPKPAIPKTVTVVGYADSEDGLEALVVAINGKTTRPDGSIYHITWSLDPDKYKPVQSNGLVNDKFMKVDPIKINVTSDVLK